MITVNQSSPRLSFSLVLFFGLLGIATLACGAFLRTPTPEPTAIVETVEILPDSGVAIVAANTAVLRSEPDAGSERLMDLHQGDVVTLLARTADGDWIEVMPLDATTRGWTGARFLAFVTPTPSATAGETATATASPTTTATVASPDTPTSTSTAAPPATASATLASIAPTPQPPDTPTFTPTVAPAFTVTPEPPDTPTWTPTASPTTFAPLTMGVDITWRLDPADSNEAIASVLISASGGNGAYTYYRDGIAQPGPTFEYRWRTCTANPVSFRVTSGAESVETSRYEIPPCPPDTPTPTSTIAVTAVPSP